MDDARDARDDGAERAERGAAAARRAIGEARALADRARAPLLARAPWKDRLADAVSLAPAVAYVALLALYAIARDPYYVVVAAGMTTVAVATELLKGATRPWLARAPWLARPRGARGCGALNGDDCETERAVRGACPGMPSGHQAMTAFFVFSMIFYHRLTVVNAPLWLALLALNVAVGAARVYKQCHTVPQVVAGSAGGILAAVALYQLADPPFRLE